MSEKAFLVAEIDAAELAGLIEVGSDNYRLLDVREPEECSVGKLSGAHCIPLMELEERVAEVEAMREGQEPLLVVYCRSGYRSAKAAEWLLSKGIENIKNLKGGLKAYVEERGASIEVA